MERYVCIHGHFYQPPRENPWLESVEVQHPAYPYHDWNERITAECYAPNATSRILNGENRITQIVNNYSKISFDVGPTLLTWMERHAPDVYQAILDADRESQKAFSGHGSAIAQAYNHLIMPLSNRRDKVTQVIWGIKDFQHRFGRFPEGMWLPETAVDLETLDIMAEQGIKFTILAPHQASRVRQIGTDTWEDASGSQIDPTRAYLLHLASDREISIFFYDGPVSRAIAFEGLLSSGVNFANRLASAFSDKRTWPQLVHIATDGESYGHHHRFGDMALAYAIHQIEEKNLARITCYGEFLEKYPPSHEVAIFENTSWSCSHGIERWRADCGCNTGSHPGWNQAWRAPLREALDWLRDTLALKFTKQTRQLLKDPWQARDDYVSVLLDRSQENTSRFLEEHVADKLDKAARTEALKLMELQRHAMQMYTSCGWFFDEISGIETVQVMQYASRAVQLGEELFGEEIEPHFLRLLEKAKSNLKEHGNGKSVYEKFVKPAMVDLPKVVAHYAISSLFEKYPAQTKIFCYNVDTEIYETSDCGKTRIAVGKARVTSEITQESLTASFGVIHFSDHNVNAGVRKFRGEEAFQSMLQELTQACTAADFPSVIRLLDKHFDSATYSLKSLFRDEQNKVLARVLESSLAEVEAAYGQLYQTRYPLMRFLVDLGSPLPRALQSVAEFTLNTDLRKTLAADTPEAEAVRKLLEDARLWNIQLDTVGLGHVFRQTLERKMAGFASHPEDRALLDEMVSLVDLVSTSSFVVDIRLVQNVYYQMLKAVLPQLQKKAEEGDQPAQDWVTHFLLLGEKLAMRVVS